MNLSKTIRKISGAFLMLTLAGVEALAQADSPPLKESATVPLDKYGFTAYIPNTDLMDAGFDYGRMVIVKDQLCEGTRWHTRKVPDHPEADLFVNYDEAIRKLPPPGATFQKARIAMYADGLNRPE